MNKDEKWMQIAIQEAIKAEKKNEVPVGAILVRDDLVVARAHNNRYQQMIQRLTLRFNC